MTYGQLARASRIGAFSQFAALLPSSRKEVLDRLDLIEWVQGRLSRYEAQVKFLWKKHGAIETQGVLKFENQDQLAKGWSTLQADLQALDEESPEACPWEPIEDRMLGNGDISPAAIKALIDCGVVKRSAKDPAKT